MLLVLLVLFVLLVLLVLLLLLLLFFLFLFLFLLFILVVLIFFIFFIVVAIFHCLLTLLFLTLFSLGRLCVGFDTLTWCLDVVSAFIWWILLDEGRKPVDVIHFPFPTTSHALSSDNALLNRHENFWQVTILTGNILLNEF